jgi:hypothetical protein
MDTDAFDVSFPTGTIVHDESSQSVQVVEEQGRIRPANAAEIDALVKPRATVMQSVVERSNSWRVLVGAAAVGIAGAFIILRRRYLRRHSASLA